jgi:hypothetical protein
MKTLLGTLALLLSQQSLAGIGNCPAHALANPKDRRMIEFLQEMQGRYQLGSCYVEIQTCNTSGTEEESRENIVADMLIVDKDGFERYIPFYVPEFKNSKTRQIELQNARMLHYKFQDTNYDQASGRDERWAVEFVKTSDLKKLEYIEVGYSSEMQRAKKIAKKWIICGTERENEVSRRPATHKIKSWMRLIYN